MKWMLLLCLWWAGGALYAQPSFQAFRKHYVPHGERPGLSEPAAEMMNVLAPETTASFLKNYWESNNKDLVFALLVSIEREKAALALEAMGRDLAVEILAYLPQRWSLDLAWYFSPTLYNDIAPRLDALTIYAPVLIPQDNPSNVGLGQSENLLFDEQFTSNLRLWEGFDAAPGIARKVQGGNLYMQHMHADGGHFFDKGIYFDPEKPFYIETALQYLSQDPSASYAITWGRSDVYSYFAFSVRPHSQQFQVYSIDKGKMEVFVPWTNISHLLHQEGYQMMAVGMQGQTLVCSLNGQEVARLPYKKLYGQHTGFMLMGRAEALADYLLVRAPQPVIDVVAGEISGAEALGESINTEALEHTAVVTADGKTLYFSRNSGDMWDNDIWVSKWDGSWGIPQRLPAPINNAGSNSVVSASPDGLSLILNNLYDAQGRPAGKGLSISHFSEAGWSLPQALDIEDYYNLQTVVSHSMATNGKVLIMAVERSDSYGNLDLYVSFLGPEGKWSKPTNMGSVLNSRGQESGPFLAADNQTLYFSTDGQPGYGNADVFVSRRLDDTWTQWSKPQNLGSGINSEQWDGYYSVPASGDYAYFCSYQNAQGQADIFRVKLSEAAKPAPVTLVYGVVRDSSTLQPIPASVVYEDLETGEIMGVLQVPAGAYKIVLPQGKHISIRAEAQGYIAMEEDLDLRANSHYGEWKQDLFLMGMKVGQTVRIHNIFFERGKADLLSKSFPELNRLVKLLRNNPRMRIRIDGHTDSIGDAERLSILSLERATAVKDYLVHQGIDAMRIQERGYGKDRPVASNDTEENRQKNRRVEFVILKL